MAASRPRCSAAHPIHLARGEIRTNRADRQVAVLDTACAQNMAWQEQGLPPMRIAVNLSPRQFTDPNLLENIRDALANSGMMPQLLDLEITESMMMQNADGAMRVLTALKKLGVHLAIDDFGTGYSSMGLYQAVPDRCNQGRSLVRSQSPGRCQRLRHYQRCHRARQGARPYRCRRGRGDKSAGAVPARAGLQRDPGLLVHQATTWPRVRRVRARARYLAAQRQCRVAWAFGSSQRESLVPRLRSSRTAEPVSE